MTAGLECTELLPSLPRNKTWGSSYNSPHVCPIALSDLKGKNPMRCLGKWEGQTHCRGHSTSQRTEGAEVRGRLGRTATRQSSNSDEPLPLLVPPAGVHSSFLANDVLETSYGKTEKMKYCQVANSSLRTTKSPETSLYPWRPKTHSCNHLVLEGSTFGCPPIFPLKIPT